jgi:RNA polymerase sigma factor (sigma-70 family)
VKTDAVIREHSGLVRKIARRLSVRMPSSVTADELYVAGLCGLWHAAEAFDPASGVKFSTYAGQRIRWAMTDWLRDSDVKHGGTRRPNGRDRHTAPGVRQFAELPNPEGAPDAEEEFIPSDGGQGAVDARDAFDAMLRGLSRAAQLIVSACLCSGCTIAEAGRAVGFHQSQAGRVLTRSLAILREKHAA